MVHHDIFYLKTWLTWILHFFIDVDLTLFFYWPGFDYPDLIMKLFFYEPGFDYPALNLTLFFYELRFDYPALNLTLFFLWTWIWFSWLGSDIFLWTSIWFSWLDFDIIFDWPGFDYPDLILTFFCGPGFEYFFGISYGMWGAGDPEQGSWKARKNAEYKVT